MDFIYPFFIAFSFIFTSELCDKTQLLVLSFSSKIKGFTILLGVALGSFFSHGIAILFGSFLGTLENPFFNNLLKFITYFSFILFGIITLLKKSNDSNNDFNHKSNILQKLSDLHLSYILIISLSIAIGELGDKTFLTSLGLGIQYPNSKFFLILGAILGMVVSDAIAIILGKFITKIFSTNFINSLSGLIFIIFGILGFINFIF
ncbi:MAG: TMEM165/GDT1 family protein [Clostridia bacterium]|jgi:putative Ca2+/H+ antiporter (TMEM165/GDT1 family)|nr:TMEM165/GDT1 family protein [Clostridia bacterium]